MSDTTDRVPASGSEGAAPPPPAVAWDAPSGAPAPPAPPQPDGGVRSGSLVASSKALVADIDDRLSRAELPFDSLRSGVEWWYRPFVERRTWTALGSLFVGAIWGPVMFAIAALIFFPTLALTLAVVGLLLIVPAFAALTGLASIERARAGWVGNRIETPHFASGAGGPFSAIGARLGDGARWRQVLFFALFLFGGPLLFSVGAAPWAFLLSRMIGVDFDLDTDTFSFFGLLVAVALAGAAPRITVGVAWVGRAFTAALLGPTESAELQERVTELSGQRQQILDAVGEERRRIERNLHDGVQQQLVALGIDIGRANARIETDPDGARQLLDEAREKVRGSIGELRLIGRGLHPAVLEDRGLDAALSAVVAGAPIPIAIDITTTATLQDDIASTAYYVASEAVANILKHARARVASIRLDDAVLANGMPGIRLTVHDDGRGGADPTRGSGLVGIRARVVGVDGTLEISSPPGGPTTLVVMLPIAIRPR